MDFLFLVGRILYGGFFLMNGLLHIFKGGMLAQYAASKGLPAPKLAVYGSGLFILLGGAGILLGVYIEWSVLLIAVFLVLVTLKMHNFWAVTDPNLKMMEQVNFTKNMALLGAALMLLQIHSPWLWSISLP